MRVYVLFIFFVYVNLLKYILIICKMYNMGLVLYLFFYCFFILFKINDIVFYLLF